MLNFEIIRQRNNKTGKNRDLKTKTDLEEQVDYRAYYKLSGRWYFIQS